MAAESRASERRRHLRPCHLRPCHKEPSPLLAVSILLMATLALSACDGGIFGTGAGGDDGPGIVASGGEGGGASTMNPEGSADEGSTVDTAAGDDAGEDTGDDGGTTEADGDDGGGGSTSGIDAGSTDSPGSGTADGAPEPAPEPPSSVSVPQSGFSNTLSGGTEPVPRVGMINATARGLQLYRDDGNTLSPVMSVPAQETGMIATVPMSSVALMVFDFDDASSPQGDIAREDALYRIEPLELGTASVTSLLARESRAGRGIDVVPLATQTISDDPAQTLVRIVLAVDLSAETLSTFDFTLTPAGQSPGGAEVVFTNPSYREPSAEYFAVAAGDYRLSVTDDRFAARSLSIPPGKVYTLVITANDALSIIVDSPQ